MTRDLRKKTILKIIGKACFLARLFCELIDYWPKYSTEMVYEL